VAQFQIEEERGVPMPEPGAAPARPALHNAAPPLARPMAESSPRSAPVARREPALAAADEEDWKEF